MVDQLKDECKCVPHYLGSYYSFCNHLKDLILLYFIKKVVNDSKTRPRGFGESSEDLDQEIVPFGSMQLVFHESFRISIIQNVVMRKHHV